MAERIGRIAFGAGFGAMLGFLWWMQQGLSRWTPIFPVGSIDACAAIGALFGASFVVVTDLLGLDLPILPEGGLGDRSSKEAPPYRDPDRSLSGSGLPSQSVESLFEALHATRDDTHVVGEQLATLTFGIVFAGLGFLAQLFWAGTAGALGSEHGGMPLYLLALGAYGVVAWRGGTAWRVTAAAFAAPTVWLFFETTR